MDDSLCCIFVHQATVMSMEEIIEGIRSEDPTVQFQSTQSARKLLSRERQPPIDDILNAGVVPQLVAFLACMDRYVLLPGSVQSLNKL